MKKKWKNGGRGGGGIVHAFFIRIDIFQASLSDS